MYRFTLVSSNAKTGRIPVTYSPPSTCPDSCPLKARGCYAKIGPVSLVWRNLPLSLSALCAEVRKLPAGQLWRHNVAGDLPGRSDEIDTNALRQLVRANEGRKGFTYTHKPLSRSNLNAIHHANANGFTVNLSADNLHAADEKAATGLSTVTLLPIGATNCHTPAGRRVVVCPAVTHDNVTCSTCRLCANPTRKVIIGFPSHGTYRKIASEIASS